MRKYDKNGTGKLEKDELKRYSIDCYSEMALLSAASVLLNRLLHFLRWRKKELHLSSNTTVALKFKLGLRMQILSCRGLLRKHRERRFKINENNETSLFPHVSPHIRFGILVFCASPPRSY